MLVGGMVGALVGIKQQPTDMLERVWCFDCENDEDARKRPELVNVSKNAMANISKLIEKRPKMCFILNEKELPKEFTSLGDWFSSK